MLEIEDNSITRSLKGLHDETLASTDTTSLSKELRVSSLLKDLIEEHEAQSLIVESLKEELDYLEQNPFCYFQNRKQFSISRLHSNTR